MRSATSPRRVVVTGLGLISPLGVGVLPSWTRLIAGDCGIQRITHFNCESLPSKVAACVPRGMDSHPNSYLGPTVTNHTPSLPYCSLFSGSGSHEFAEDKWIDKKVQKIIITPDAMMVSNCRLFMNRNEHYVPPSFNLLCVLPSRPSWTLNGNPPHKWMLNERYHHPLSYSGSSCCPPTT